MFICCGGIFMTKKFLSVLLAIVMVISIAPVSVFAEDNILDYLTYEIANGEVVITDCNESISGDVIIPDTIAGYPVTTIGSMAFAYCEGITGITIPDTATTIEFGAFYNCTGLKGVFIIPDNVMYLGSYALCGCDNIEHIIFGKGITSLKDSTISYYANNLKSITFSNNVINIDHSALGYGGCLNLSDIYYSGSEEEWNAITVNDSNIITIKEYKDTIINPNAKIHFNSTAPHELIPQYSSILLTESEDSITIEPENSIIHITDGKTVETVSAIIMNECFIIVDKDNNKLDDNTFIGTGSKVQILDNDGKVLSEYDVVVNADVNGDATITAADARLALRASANLDKIEGVYAIAANYNGDDDITAADARKILRKSAGLE